MENTLEQTTTEQISSKYNVAISNFEGPLDLLCFLISKNKNEKTKIVNYPMDKYLKDKYNCSNYKYITDLQVR